jgi:carboxylesterase type B
MSGSGVGTASFLAFMGVPYALPPVGALRFRNPVPHPGWGGVWDATRHRSTCQSAGWFGLEVGSGAEDCLYLNVYTSQLAGSRPVMVWIHGGSFTGGSGNHQIYGPSHLINDVIY